MKRSHGESQRSVEYRAWASMLTRCYNPAVKCFVRYGGRGVTVCDRWRHSYENFLADMGRKPTPHHSLDRKENNGNYEPGNCRWATPEEQMRNTRRSRILTVRGESLTLGVWAERTGISHATIWSRLQLGWDAERAVTEPALGRAEACRQAQRRRVARALAAKTSDMTEASSTT